MPAEVFDVERKVLDAVGKAMGRFSMLRRGDRIAIGISGGKDSLCLLHALLAYRRRAPFEYELVAITIEQGKFKSPCTGLQDLMCRIGVNWVCVEDPLTLKLVAKRKEHGCDVCSRNRRRVLYEAASRMGCTVLALGHTAVDCAESLFRNILFNGRIASLPPVAQSRKGGLRVIRPLVYVSEDLTSEYARLRGFESIGCVCSEKENVRSEIRRFLDQMRAQNAHVARSIAAALGNVNPYTLFDPSLQKSGIEPSPAFAVEDGYNHPPAGEGWNSKLHS